MSLMFSNYKKAYDSCLNETKSIVRIVMAAKGYINFNIDFRRANFKKWVLKNENFDQINFSRSKFNNSDLSNSSFELSSLFSSNFSGANLQSSKFVAADLSYACFDNCDLRGVDFSFSILTGIRVKGAKFGGNNGITIDLRNWLESKGAEFDESYVFPLATKSVAKSQSVTSISETFVRNFGSPSFDLLNDPGPYTSEVVELVGGDQATAKTVLAMIFWESFSNSNIIDHYFKVSSHTDVLFDKERASMQIVAYGKERRSGYGLSIFSEQFCQPYPFAIKKVYIPDDELISGWKSVSKNWTGSEYIKKLRDIGGFAATELNKKYEFPLLISAPPIIQLNASFIDSNDIGLCTSEIKEQLFGISKEDDSHPRRSIGVFCTKDNDFAVTTALHDDGNDFSNIGDFVKVYFKGNVFKGAVVSKHHISDSCLIKLEDELDLDIINRFKDSKRPSEKVPTFNEPVHFYSFKRRKVITTKLKAFQYDFLSVIYNPANYKRIQVTINTAPKSVDGDSGTALYNSTGELLGFCFYRTCEYEEYTAWIWANSVFYNHGIQ